MYQWKKLKIIEKIVNKNKSVDMLFQRLLKGQSKFMMEDNLYN